MKSLINKKWFWYTAYLLFSLIGIWFLTRYWVPQGYVIAGHDSGLAVESGEFFKTRMYAWDGRLNFGSDNSPHFGSIVMHFIDYLISLVAQVPYAGSQVAVFFWISAIFISAFIFSYSLKDKFGDYFTILFPVFLTFNFFILQSIFILERAKYELIISTLIYLTLSLKIFDKEKVNLLKYSIIFSVTISIFNGGGWFGLPLYGGLFVLACTLFIFAFLYGVKNKNYSFFVNIFKFNFLNLIFYLLLNAYSILPYLSTLINSDYAKVVSQGTINAGYEWLSYISRGSSFLNLFRLQGIPDWYLTGYRANPDHAYADLYLNNSSLIFASFAVPVFALLGLFGIQKNFKNKYLISYFLMLLLVSMFFTSGTNSPLGFVYELLYTKVPGFNIFRSPYYKFAPTYLISFSFFLSYTLSLLFLRIDKLKFLKAPVFIFILFSWFWYHQIIFDRDRIFSWQPNKSTLVQIPKYVDEFARWSKDNKLEGRILILPPYNEMWRDDSYNWGYWSLSPLQSLLSKNLNFLSNDLNINSGESVWVDEMYRLISVNDFDNFLTVASRLNTKYIFVKSDYANNNDIGKINTFLENSDIKLVKSFDLWNLYSINNLVDSSLFEIVNSVASIPSSQQFFQAQIYDEQYSQLNWVDSNNDTSFKDVLEKKIYPVACDSCQIENLGKYAQTPIVRILPNSPLYRFKQARNDKDIENAQDPQSRLGVYMGLVMLKLSEIKSMFELKVEKEILSKSIKDLNSYLTAMTSIVQSNNLYQSNFYLASKTYEVINPVQRYFRDYLNKPDYYFDKSYFKDDILSTLWNSVSLKKMFDPVADQGEKWGYEKLYRLSSIPKSDYQLLIDTQTLPSDIEGGYKLPDKISFSNDDFEYKISNILGSRFAYADIRYMSGESFILHFSDLPDLYSKKESTVLDFPEGEKGCEVGEIKNFNKHRMYRFKISSSKDSDTFRFYVKEQDNNSLLGFINGDIEIDITTDKNSKHFEYIYAPSAGAKKPQIYLCRYNKSIPDTASVSAYEIYSPLVYLVADSKIAFDSSVGEINSQKINPTKYKLVVRPINEKNVLLFNTRFNNLWKLTDNKTGDVIRDHYIINGYANGWILNSNESRELTLEYTPQKSFDYGKMISIVSLFVLTGLFMYASKHD